jgi:hypothetical protein
MSQDIGDRPNLRVRSVSLWLGVLGLVVPGGVEGEFAEQFTGALVDDPDVEVLDEQEDVGSATGSSDADVAQAAVVADGDDAGVIDAVAADPLVGRGDARARRKLVLMRTPFVQRQSSAGSRATPRTASCASRGAGTRARVPARSLVLGLYDAGRE